jgi:hypothetical protein
MILPTPGEKVGQRQTIPKNTNAPKGAFVFGGLYNTPP